MAVIRVASRNCGRGSNRVIDYRAGVLQMHWRHDGVTEIDYDELRDLGPLK
jgi:hypothetical protein